MTTKELKEKYLKFFEKKGHTIISGSSLIPENDPTALFISAGMHPLVPYLLGEKHASGKRLVNFQKCIRTNDIDKVGNDFHLTYFEMLGNWSLGDYWKQEAIKMSYEFLIDELRLDPNKLAISCFEGDDNVSKDEESFNAWKSLGISEKRIKFLGRESNWWGPAGKIGPCGPDTEMFYHSKDNAPEEFDPNDSNWVEIWNDVFMEYNKTSDGKYEPLSQKNVDTGMGVERTVAILNNLDSVYEIDELRPLILKIKELASSKDIKAERIIADHVRAAINLISDGVVPSNLEQGYVLRRLIRRAIRYAKKIGIDSILEIAKLISNNIDLLKDEEDKFKKTLEKGLKEFENRKEINGKQAFVLFSTYGFPFEMTKELAKEKGIKIDEDEFKKELEKHQELSRTATAGKFKSGLADDSEQVTKLHTAAHLLLAALRKVLGNHVFQKGSNITFDRLRLDFSHSEKLTDEELKKVEDIVNEKIKENLEVYYEEMSLEEAKKKNAMGVFESKYGDKVKVYSVGDFSCEICGGPHIKSTGELGKFKIKKQESSSAGVRRIKGILE
ncbi:alanine--tRNA ligase [Patescibacteria group bacterium]|nr:alanine--tRNA ligase [Patescibacteria group bacterium]